MLSQNFAAPVGAAQMPSTSRLPSTPTPSGAVERAFRDLAAVDDALGRLRDQLVRDVCPEQLAQMALDIARAHSTIVER